MTRVKIQVTFSPMLNAAPELRIEYHHSSPSITVMRSPSCIWVTTRYLVPWSMANTTAASTRALSQAVRPLRMRDARPVLSVAVSAVRTGAEDSA